MKKILLSIMAIGIIFCSTAQKRSGFGLHAGVSATSEYDLDYGYYDDQDPMDGFQAGIRYNLKFGPIGICPEINYTSVKSGVKGIHEQTLNYVSVPLLFKFYISGFNIQFGAQVSQLLSGTLKEYETSTSITEDRYPFYYTSDAGIKHWLYEDMDIAAVVGVGLDTKMGLYGSLRAIASINPYFNTEWWKAEWQDELGFELPGTELDLLARLVSVQMSVGYQF